MTRTRLSILLEQSEYNGLTQLASLDLRSPSDQLRHILRAELVRHGQEFAGNSACIARSAAVPAEKAADASA
jgi:hypothetical protein